MNTEQLRYFIRNARTGGEETTYWSNDHGWTSFEEATAFTPEEKEMVILPVEGIWLPLIETIECNMNTDPTRADMVDAINTIFDTHFSLGPELPASGTQEFIDRFELEEALYWFASDHHSGQTSNLYSVLSTSEYKPGTGIQYIEQCSEQAQEYYAFLLDRFTLAETSVTPEPDGYLEEGQNVTVHSVNETNIQFVDDYGGIWEFERKN